MKRQIVAFAGCLVFSAAVVAQSSPPPQDPAPQAPTTQVPPDQQQPKPFNPDPKPAAPELTLTGCLIQGTGPDVFLLDNAKMSPADRGERGRSYVLSASTEDLFFRSHLNHEVSVTGTPEEPKDLQPPAGQKLDERNLPKFNARSVTMVSDRCLASSR
jgi:hypothetical protein